jgi:adenine-specific DNA glycosylase
VLTSGHPQTEFLHKTTHRDVYFRVWAAQHERARSVPTPRDESWRWVRLEELDGLGLSNPQAGILRAALG